MEQTFNIQYKQAVDPDEDAYYKEYVTGGCIWVIESILWRSCFFNIIVTSSFNIIKQQRKQSHNEVFEKYFWEGSQRAETVLTVSYT